MHKLIIVLDNIIMLFLINNCFLAIIYIKITMELLFVKFVDLEMLLLIT